MKQAQACCFTGRRYASCDRRNRPTVDSGRASLLRARRVRHRRPRVDPSAYSCRCQPSPTSRPREPSRRRAVRTVGARARRLIGMRRPGGGRKRQVCRMWLRASPPAHSPTVASCARSGDGAAARATTIARIIRPKGLYVNEGVKSRAENAEEEGG